MSKIDKNKELTNENGEINKSSLTSTLSKRFIFNYFLYLGITISLFNHFNINFDNTIMTATAILPLFPTFMFLYFRFEKLKEKAIKENIEKKFNFTDMHITKLDSQKGEMFIRTKTTNKSFIDSCNNDLDSLSDFLGFEDGYVEWVYDERTNKRKNLIYIKMFTNEQMKDFFNLEIKMKSKILVNAFELKDTKISFLEDGKIVFNVLSTEENYMKSIESKLNDIAYHLGYIDGYTKWDIDEDTKVKKNSISLRMFTHKEKEDFDNLDNDMKKKILYEETEIKKFEIINDDLKKNTLEINFKSKTGMSSDKSELKNSINNLVNFFDVFSGRLVEKGGGVYSIVFKSLLPTIADGLGLLKSETTLEKNKLYLGSCDKTSTKLAKTTNSKEQRGKLNGHMMIVGASGSGKSFGFNIIMQNWLTPMAYKEIEQIYILNFKGSADYNHLLGLDKVRYSGGDAASAGLMIKKVESEMNKRYIYNFRNDYDIFPGQKILFIIDEIQTIQEKSSDNLPQLEKNTWIGMESPLMALNTKARAANISLITVLQNGTASNLPGGKGYRNNNRHRFGLKNDSANLLFKEELVESQNIDMSTLKQAQFIYMDELMGAESLIEGFIQGVDTPLVQIGNDELNKLKDKRILNNKLMTSLLENERKKDVCKKLVNLEGINDDVVELIYDKMYRDNEISKLNDEGLKIYAEENDIDLKLKDGKNVKDFIKTVLNNRYEFEKNILDYVKEFDYDMFIRQEFPEENFSSFTPKSKEELNVLYKEIGLDKDKDSSIDKERIKELELCKKVADELRRRELEKMEELEESGKKTIIEDVDFETNDVEEERYALIQEIFNEFGIDKNDKLQDVKLEEMNKNLPESEDEEIPMSKGEELLFGEYSKDKSDYLEKRKKRNNSIKKIDNLIKEITTDIPSLDYEDEDEENIEEEVLIEENIEEPQNNDDRPVLSQLQKL